MAVITYIEVIPSKITAIFDLIKKYCVQGRT